MKQKADILNALMVLTVHLKEIHTVEEWAEQMEYTSTRQFARLFKQEFKIAPVHMLSRIKLTCLIWAMCKNPKASLFDLANEIGLKDEIDLNKFVHYHLHLSPTRLREKILQDVDK